MAKVTKAEQSERILFVQELLLAGHTRFEIIAQCTAKYTLKPRAIDELIAKATAQIKEVNQISLQDNMALITSNLWDLFRFAKRTNNVAEANKILMNIAKLKGLDVHAQTLIIQDERELANLSDDDLDKMLAGEYVSPAKH